MAKKVKSKAHLFVATQPATPVAPKAPRLDKRILMGRTFYFCNGKRISLHEYCQATGASPVIQACMDYLALSGHVVPAVAHYYRGA
jgi:hypothetical protein